MWPITKYFIYLLFIWYWWWRGNLKQSWVQVPDLLQKRLFLFCIQAARLCCKPFTVVCTNSFFKNVFTCLFIYWLLFTESIKFPLRFCIKKKKSECAMFLFYTVQYLKLLLSCKKFKNILLWKDSFSENHENWTLMNKTIHIFSSCNLNYIKCLLTMIFLYYFL